MHDLPLISTIAAGFAAAWVLGLFTQWLRLSPIVGYLLAGVLIGPHTPGFRGDLYLAHQLAEIGVILLMFGVGLHFHLEDLVAVKRIAIPGALGQSLGATVVAMLVFTAFGMDFRSGAVLGMAMAVASTVVLMRVLMDADALSSPAGHVAVGWLLVEDVLTVLVLVMIPVLGGTAPTEGLLSHPLAAIAVALLKLAALIGLVMVAGTRLVPWVLTQVARLRSRELFTLTVLVFSIALAAGAYALFGASMALGAFLAGMMVGRSPVSHQAAADALPLRDAFAVLFFVSVGMLFDPAFLLEEPLMVLAALGIIMLIKPLIALAIVAILGYSGRTALTVAIGLAQIGEFSFILSDLARKYGLMPDAGHTVLVAGAIISITLNPLLFRSLDRIEAWMKRRPGLWKLLNAQAERRLANIDGESVSHAGTAAKDGTRLAVVVGYGPVGKTVERLLRQAGLNTIVIDMNMDTVADLRRKGQTAVFGDASREAILESAGVGHASHLVLTLPHTADRAAVVAAARNLNPKVKTFVRAHYMRERGELEHVGATAAIFEEAEAAVALARLVMADAGARRESVEAAVRDIRTRLILENVSALRNRTVRTIMVPWTRVRRLTTSAGGSEVRKQVQEQRYSRWPVVDVQTRHPIGYLLAKDLIGLPAEGTDWTSMVRPLGTVRSDDDVESVLQYFQREAATIALVVEQGTPVGIVTVEDILEQVVGRIEDEYPRHPKATLRNLLVTSDRLLDLAGRTAEEVLFEMATRIPANKLPQGVDVGALAIARERELSTALGHSVAVPHARVPQLAEPLVVVGRSTSGVVFDPDSPDLIHLIFLLVTPADQPNLQVQLLAQVARIAADPVARERLRAANYTADVEAVLAALPSETKTGSTPGKDARPTSA